MRWQNVFPHAAMKIRTVMNLSTKFQLSGEGNNVVIALCGKKQFKLISKLFDALQEKNRLVISLASGGALRQCWIDDSWAGECREAVWGVVPY